MNADEQAGEADYRRTVSAFQAELARVRRDVDRTENGDLATVRRYLIAALTAGVAIGFS
jgi:hypothetical protein